MIFPLCFSRTIFTDSFSEFSYFPFLYISWSDAGNLQPREIKYSSDSVSSRWPSWFLSAALYVRLTSYQLGPILKNTLPHYTLQYRNQFHLKKHNLFIYTDFVSFNFSHLFIICSNICLFLIFLSSSILGEKMMMGIKLSLFIICCDLSDSRAKYYFQVDTISHENLFPKPILWKILIVDVGITLPIFCCFCTLT